MAGDGPGTRNATPPAVSVSAAELRDVVSTNEVTGSLVAREDVVVTGQISGYAVTDIAAEEGDHVEAGQILARLSPDRLHIQLAQNAAILRRHAAAIAQAQSQIDQMRSGQIQAAAALDRAERLAKVGAATQEVLDQRLSTAAAAKAQVAFAQESLALANADKALAEAQRAELELDLARTEIRAPARGTILSRSVQIGAMVSAGGAALFHIAQDSTVELAATVVESSLSDLAPGQSVSVHLEGRPEPVTGRVRLVSPEIDKVTRLGKVRIALPPGPGLRVGLFARAEIEVARHNGIVVPPSAILFGSGRESVKVVIDGKVETREIATGIRAPGSVEVVGGVDEGQMIVVRAGSFLHDGQAVTSVRTAWAGTTR